MGYSTIGQGWDILFFLYKLYGIGYDVMDCFNRFQSVEGKEIYEFIPYKE